MTFLSYGDLGDFCYLLPCMKLVAEQSGQPSILYAKDGLRLHDPITARLYLIEDLLTSQPYVEALRPYNGEHIDFDASEFRRGGHEFGITLATLQAQWLGLSPDLHTPWLQSSRFLHGPRVEAIDKIVINRSPRYHNVFFPWGALVECFGKHMLFIGHPHEHADFCEEFGMVEYLPTENLLEAAEAIATSELFIGNQSSCFAIAEALKHDSIQETDLSTPDCIFVRPNAIHCHDGALDFTFGDKHFTSKNRLFVRAHLNDTPPGGWRVAIGEHEAISYAFDLTLSEITAKLRRAGLEVPRDLKEMIIEQNSIQHTDHPVARLKAQLSIS